AASVRRAADVVVVGRDAGGRPRAKRLSLPVGRHAVRVGDEETRVRISHGRIARLVAGKDGGLAILSGAPPAAIAAAEGAAEAVRAPEAAEPGAPKLYSAAFTPVRIPLRPPTTEGRSIAGRVL